MFYFLQQSNHSDGNQNYPDTYHTTLRRPFIQEQQPEHKRQRHIQTPDNRGWTSRGQLQSLIQEALTTEPCNATTDGIHDALSISDDLMKVLLRSGARDHSCTAQTERENTEHEMHTRAHCPCQHKRGRRSRGDA